MTFVMNTYAIYLINFVASFVEKRIEIFAIFRHFLDENKKWQWGDFPPKRPWWKTLRARFAKILIIQWFF